jgi:hypothetical protein
MKLTKNQRTLLKFYARHRTTPPSPSSVFRSIALPWVLLAVLIAIASTVYFWLGMPVAAWLCIGAFAGVVLRDIGRLRLVFRTWPAVHAVLDWERLEELLASDAPGEA